MCKCYNDDCDKGKHDAQLLKSSERLKLKVLQNLHFCLKTLIFKEYSKWATSEFSSITIYFSFQDFKYIGQ